MSPLQALARLTRASRVKERGGRSHWFWAIALCLVGGVLLRWINLEGKVFWHDEVFTALRVVGYLGSEVTETLFTGSPITAETLLRYQTFAPGSTFGDTLRSLIDHPEHPPLYYLLSWVWVKLFTPSITAFRSLAVIFSLLTFPAIAFLSWELFGNRPAVVIALLLFAYSPVHILYAQEAREYSLWVLLIVLANGGLLRAIRLGTAKAWGLYSVILALTLYTSVLSVLVAIAHGIYGILVLPRRKWITLGMAEIGAIILFLPWLSVMALKSVRLNQATAWTVNQELPKVVLAKLWGLHFAALWIDPNLPIDHPYNYLIPPLILAAIGIVLYSCWRQLPRKISFFLLVSILFPTVSLIGGDLLRGSILSVHTRYFMPALIGIQLSVAGWLGKQYFHQKRLILFGLTSLLSLQFVSCIFLLEASTWWSKGTSYYNREVASAIQSFEQPVILTQNKGTTLGDLISLSYYLPPKTSFVVTNSPTIPVNPPAESGTVLLFQPSPMLLNAYSCPAKALPVPGELWELPC